MGTILTDLNQLWLKLEKIIITTTIIMTMTKLFRTKMLKNHIVISRDFLILFFGGI